MRFRSGRFCSCPLVVSTVPEDEPGGSDSASGVASIDEDVVEAFRDGLLEWSRGNLRAFPWRDDDREPYEVLLAEILLQRTRAETVVPVYLEFLESYPDFEAIREADASDIAELLEPLGLHNRRSRSIKRIAERLDGTAVPREVDDLLELPHVGPYVANATACFGRGQPAPLVDSNIRRVFKRIFDVEAPDPRDDALWSFAARLLPEEDARRFNLAILDFAAAACTPTSPRCEDCFANEYCRYYAEDATSKD